MDNKTEEERRKDNCEKHRHWRENLDSERLESYRECLESYREYHRQYDENGASRTEKQSTGRN